jgi:hypothetical protein
MPAHCSRCWIACPLMSVLPICCQQVVNNAVYASYVQHGEPFLSVCLQQQSTAATPTAQLVSPSSMTLAPSAYSPSNSQQQNWVFCQKHTTCVPASVGLPFPVLCNFCGLLDHSLERSPIKVCNPQIYKDLWICVRDCGRGTSGCHHVGSALRVGSEGLVLVVIHECTMVFSPA